jgi:poly-gamma-glutamate synthesis protein (capsule biosynthesis protein)
VDFSYVWGDALDVMDRQAPDLRLINLETAVTTHDEPLPKGINYRMHPANLPVLDAAGVEGCMLANNHVLDWGVEGLLETLESRSSVVRACIQEAIEAPFFTAPRMPTPKEGSVL